MNYIKRRPALLALLACTMLGNSALVPALAVGDDNTWQTLLTTGDNQLEQQKLVEAEACYRQALKEVEHGRHNQDDVVKCLEKLASTLTQENKTDEALPLYQKSLHLLERAYGKDSAKVVPILFALGSIFEAEGDPKLAMGLYQRALAINEKSYGSFSPAVADSLHFLGRTHSKLGQTQQAEHEYKESLSILMQQPSLSSSAKLQNLLADYHDLLRKNDNSDSNLISDFQTEVLNDKMGSLKQMSKVPPSAWQTQTSAPSSHGNKGEPVDMMRGASSWQKPMIAQSSSNSQQEPPVVLRGPAPSSAWQSQMATQAAQEYQRPNPLTSGAGVPVSDWQKQMFAQSGSTTDQQNNREQQVLMRGFQQPFNDSTLAPAYDTMANTLHSQSGYVEGEDRYKRMIALDIKVLGPNHPAVADDLSALALLYMSQKRYGEAKPLLIRASSIYGAVYGHDNLLYKRTRECLATTLNKLGDTKEAVAVCTETFTQGQTVLDCPNGLDTARILNELGFLYYRQGKLLDACTIYQWALASTKGALGDENVLVAACLKDYSNVLRSLGRITEAEAMQERACHILAKQS